MSDNGTVHIWLYDKSGKSSCTYIHNFIFINLLYSNFSPSLRLDSTDHIRPHCQTHAAIYKTDDMTDAWWVSALGI